MKSKIILLLSAIILFTSCDNAECERGQGRNTTETYQMSEFSAIDINSWSDVEIIKSNDHKVEIEAQPNVQARFRMNVRSNTLHVGADCFNARSKPKIKVFCSSLTSLKFSGAGNVKSSSEFISDDMDIELTGAGDVFLKGKATNVSVRVSGSGDVNLMEMEAENADIKISGVSECSVYVKENLNIKISGNGRVYYKGHPEINQEISGNGKVISQN